MYVRKDSERNCSSLQIISGCRLRTPAELKGVSNLGTPRQLQNQSNNTTSIHLPSLRRLILHARPKSNHEYRQATVRVCSQKVFHATATFGRAATLHHFFCSYFAYDNQKEKTQTYNRRDSQMVTHSSTSRPVQCLCMAERTGCPVFTDLWSYVLVSHSCRICQFVPRPFGKLWMNALEACSSFEILA